MSGDPVARWQAFEGKVRARLQAVDAEAGAGLDAIIDQQPLADQPLTAAFTTTKSRYHGIRMKVEEARQKIDADLMSGGVFAMAAGLGAREQVLASYKRLTRDIFRAADLMERERRARWGTRLQALAQQEATKAVGCSQCGGPLGVRPTDQTLNADCPHCGAANEASPGFASALYHSVGTRALAEWAADAEWQAWKAAEQAYEDSPAPANRQRCIDTYRAYQTRYYAGLAELGARFDVGPLPPADAAAIKLEQYQRLLPGG